MSDKTLYLIQSSFIHTDHILNQLDQLYGSHDHIVLMGDAVLFAADQRLTNRQNLYLLENDAEILSESIPENFKSISYPQFALLVLDFSRCISLK